MGRFLLAALCGVAAHAAVISGVVLDSSTGRPLARALVALRPVEGAGSKAASTRANHSGQFTFTVNGGMYLLNASRAGFAPFQYGQKQWRSAGKPVKVDQDGKLFLDIRLHRYAAISGTALDENEIGIPDQKVIAYLAKQPLEIAASAMTDDRGIYRIHGLEPGSYFVRTAAKELEDGSGLLPTFHKETAAVDQTIPVDADLDQQMDDVDIRPLPGKLVHVSGSVYVTPPVPIMLSLISDTGRVRTTTSGAFRFDNIAPGSYELVADGGEDTSGRGRLGAYREMTVDNDMDGVQVQITRWRETEFRIEDEKGNRIETSRAKITARRKDLDGGGRAQVLKIENNSAALGPGRWEIAITPPSGYYAASFSGYGLADSQHGRADGWNEVVLRDFSAIWIKLSSRPASVHGVVTSAQDPVPGAPVYLEAFDPESHKRLTDLRIVRTDVQGKYRFSNLAPGAYRILGTFEYDKPDVQAMDAAGARTVTLSEATDTAQDLDLYAP
ncbi:MAG: carboxypeptidase-like regulatory domain-containing protein [Bryobacteraceae bacterium]